MESDQESVNLTDKPEIKLHETMSKHGDLEKTEVSKKEDDDLPKDFNNEQGGDFKHKGGEESEQDSQILSDGPKNDSREDVNKASISMIHEESNGLDMDGFQARRERNGEDGEELLTERLNGIQIMIEGDDSIESHDMKRQTEIMLEGDDSNSEWEWDSLRIIEEVVYDFNLFIDLVFLMLKDGQKMEFHDQERIDLLSRVIDLLENMCERVSIVELVEKENLKIYETITECYFDGNTHIRQIVTQLLQISASLASSLNIAMGSLLKQKEKCTESELSSCEGVLIQSMRELVEIKLKLDQLKSKNMHASQGNGLTKKPMDTETSGVGGGDTTEESEESETYDSDDIDR